MIQPENNWLATLSSLALTQLVRWVSSKAPYWILNLGQA